MDRLAWDRVLVGGVVAYLLPRDGMLFHNFNLTTGRPCLVCVVHSAQMLGALIELFFYRFCLGLREMRATWIVRSISCALQYGSLQLGHCPEQHVGRLKHTSDSTVLSPRLVNPQPSSLTVDLSSLAQPNGRRCRRSSLCLCKSSGPNARQDLPYICQRVCRNFMHVLAC